MYILYECIRRNVILLVVKGRQFTKLSQQRSYLYKICNKELVLSVIASCTSCMQPIKRTRNTLYKICYGSPDCEANIDCFEKYIRRGTCYKCLLH